MVAEAIMRGLAQGGACPKACAHAASALLKTAAELARGARGPMEAEVRAQRGGDAVALRPKPPWQCGGGAVEMREAADDGRHAVEMRDDAGGNAVWMRDGCRWWKCDAVDMREAAEVGAAGEMLSAADGDAAVELRDAAAVEGAAVGMRSAAMWSAAVVMRDAAVEGRAVEMLSAAYGAVETGGGPLP